MQGALIGEYRYRAVAFATFVGGGPIRLLFGAGMVVAGFGVTGAIVATIFAQALPRARYSSRLDKEFAANHKDQPYALPSVT